MSLNVTSAMTLKVKNAACWVALKRAVHDDPVSVHHRVVERDDFVVPAGDAHLDVRGQMRLRIFDDLRRIEAARTRGVGSMSRCSAASVESGA